MNARGRAVAKEFAKLGIPYSEEEADQALDEHENTAGVTAAVDEPTLEDHAENADERCDCEQCIASMRRAISAARSQMRPAAVRDGQDQTERLLAGYFAVTAIGRSPVRRGPRKATRTLMDAALDVLASFQGSMSTRQVYYQIVSRGQAENSPRSYDRIQRLLVQMRRSGSVDYDRIVDRGRASHKLSGWNGIRQLMEAAHAQYRRDAWETQDTVVMVCCEKAALEGIFTEAVDEYGAQLWTIKGFNSESFAFEWANEIERLTDLGKRVVIAYFGDFDPSGVALEQDAKDKLLRHGAKFEWQRRGLLFGDFDRFNLVRVPVKKTDSRSPRFLRTFGDCAAELDALDPDELRKRVRDCVVEHIDHDAWAEAMRTAEAEKESFGMITRNVDFALDLLRDAGVES